LQIPRATAFEILVQECFSEASNEEEVKHRQWSHSLENHTLLFASMDLLRSVGESNSCVLCAGSFFAQTEACEERLAGFTPIKARWATFSEFHYR
jgi:hypothetical protein